MRNPIVSLTLSLSFLILLGCSGESEAVSQPDEKKAVEETKTEAATEAPKPVEPTELAAKPEEKAEVAEPAENVHHGNWMNWRGPLQNGVSLERYKNGKFNPEPVWSYDMEGRGTPVIHNGQLYSWGYRGAGPDLQEVLTAHDAKTGKVLWERAFSDFISDTVYNRYSVGAPAVDPETGNIYLATAYGLFMCFDPDGNTVFEISMQERYGRLTFPNGRAGAPVIDGDLVIVRAVTSYWGADGPARDRFFGYDKNTGELVWSSAPGVGPPFLKDTSFSNPTLETRDGRRVFYSGTGCGNVVCVNVADGTPLWRFQVAVGGVNSTPLIYKDTVIGIHGVENIDTTETGRMFAIKIPEDLDNTGGVVDPAQKGAPQLPANVEAWRNRLNMFTSSPILVGDTVYQVVHEGELHAVDAATGKLKWHEKLGTGQLHASPAYVDGMLVVPMSQGFVYVIKPAEDGCEILHKIKVEDECLGSPAVCDGMVYVHTKAKLYAFQIENEGITYDEMPEEAPVETGEATGFTSVPADVLLAPGEGATLRLFKTDAHGNHVGSIDPAAVAWESFVPPTAKVQARMDASFDEGGSLVAAEDAEASAGMFKGTADGLSGFARGRVLESIPFSEDFEAYELTETNSTGQKFDYPPLPWIGARLKWEVWELDGNKVLGKTLDNILFQRSMSFIGHPDASNYTISADVMTDGNRRVKSTVGLVNQRYICALVGNSNILEVSSNHERVKQSVPFSVAANTWYTLKMRVDVAEDGSGVIRGKVWEKGSAEPDAWTIEVNHKIAHKKGAPGIFGFSPQSQKSVFVDNLSITPNN